MPKQTAKKKITRRKKAKTEPLLSSPSPLTPLIITPTTTKPVPRARVVSVNTTTTPPLSPYVIRLEVDAAKTLPKIKTAEKLAPTLAEELASQKQTVTPEPEFFPEVQTPILIPKTKIKFRFPKISFKILPAFQKLYQLILSPFHWLLQSLRALPRLLPQAPLPAIVVTKEAPRKNKYKKQHQPISFNFKKFLPSTSAFRAAVSFAIIALLFVLPAGSLFAYTKIERTKNKLIEQGRATLGSIKLPGGDADITKTISDAQTHLLETKTTLESAVGSFDAILPLIPQAGATYRDGKSLLNAGNHLTEAAKIITSGFSTLNDGAIPPTTQLMNINEALRAAYPLIDAANLELDSISIESIPQNARDSVSALKTTVVAVRESALLAIDLLPQLEQFLGVDHTKRYLVIFQNPNELRPTGGFIGSFALVDFDRGVMKIIDIPGGGSYDTNCCLNEHVISPEPLHLIEPHWQFRDSNWFPDFPTSAQKIAWFYEKSGGPSVDGVISLNATVIPELLKLTGPIDVPEFNREFTAENFILETQKIVEVEYDKTENKPKKLIGLLTPKLLDRLLALPKQQWLPALEILQSALETKDVQVYSNDPEIETAFEQVGWTGELHQTNGDYLMVVSSNIAGGKTSGVIETKINHRATIANDGTIIDQLEIIRTHHGSKGEQFTGVRNVEYLRTYVPEGSELISVDGFAPPPPELFQKPNADYVPDPDLVRLTNLIETDPLTGTATFTESGKTVFGNWMQVDPGQTVTAHLAYRLPFRVIFSQNSIPSPLQAILNLPTFSQYSLLLEKQSGFTPTINSSIQFPSTYSLRWQSPSFPESGKLHFSSSLTKNLFLSVLFEH